VGIAALFFVAEVVFSVALTLVGLLFLPLDSPWLALSVLSFALPLSALVCAWGANRQGVELPTVAPNVKELLAGVVAAGLAFGLVFPSQVVDQFLFGGSCEVPNYASLPLVGLGVFFLGNCLVSPFAEEYIWRGIVQPGLTLHNGALTSLILVTTLFTLRHILLDACLGRAVTLIAFSGVLWAVRHFSGLFAAMVAHMLTNAGATAYILVERV
jgi:membrane protease YdiL (CAAX protease family)